MKRFLPMQRALLQTLSLAYLATMASAAAAQSPLSLERALQLAVESDPWLEGSHHREVALESESIAESSLPDPTINLGAVNFPTNTFDSDQEPMTQLNIGVSQRFPRGETRALSQRQKQQLAAREPLLREDRKAKVATTVTQLWLEAFRAQESIRLIEKDRALFEHLVDATKASYSSALGRARQQDVIRAQLELTRLDDRLTVLRQQLESYQQKLAEWAGNSARGPLAADLPERAPPLEMLADHSGPRPEQWYYTRVQQHPTLRALNKQILARQTEVALAKEQYKPAWGVSAQYGYRDDTPLGAERADLVSVGVSFDLPVFTAQRQDQRLKAASARVEALKTQRSLLQRQLVAQLDARIVQFKRLDQRRALYDQALLPQMAEQAEAALAAYNNDVGDFAKAVRARIAELNAKIDFLQIRIDLQKTVAELNYLLNTAPANPTKEVRP